MVTPNFRSVTGARAMPYKPIGPTHRRDDLGRSGQERDYTYAAVSARAALASLGATSTSYKRPRRARTAALSRKDLRPKSYERKEWP